MTDQIPVAENRNGACGRPQPVPLNMGHRGRVHVTKLGFEEISCAVQHFR